MILVIRGDLDLVRSARLRVTINDLLRTSPCGLVIDLGEVRFVDTTGLAVLLNARIRTQREGVDLKLVCDVRRTLELLELTRLDREFDLHPTLAAALEACGVPSTRGVPTQARIRRVYEDLARS